MNSMNAGELLVFFQAGGAELHVVDGNIKCKAPKGFMTEEVLAHLKRHKQEIIELLAQRAHGLSISRRPIDAPPALSFSQQRLWFLDQLASGSAFYNMPAAVRLTGHLDTAALAQALNEVVRRHDSLRTYFTETGGAAAPVVMPSLELPLPSIDLSDLPASESEDQARRLAIQEAQTPFDLKTGPLIRALLIRLDDERHIVVLNLHHIISDVWSLGVLIREVGLLYDAFVQGRPSPLPALPIQYADFTHWQRLWLSGDVLQSQLDYWTRQLAGAPTLLTLPTDRPRPAVQTYRGATHSFCVPPELTAALHALGKQTQTTLFMILTAAFNVLLARYSGQPDICIGTPIANRNRAEIEPLIGFFVNTLVLRSFVDGNQTFASLLQQVRTTALGAYAHQDMPFEQLVEALKPERHVSHSPLFQVMLVLQNSPMGSFALPGLSLEPLPVDSGVAKFDLALNFTESADRLLARLDYNVDLFDAATMERMVEHFLRLLQEAASRPQCRIRDLDMLAVEERRQLVDDWNATSVSSQAPTIHRLFERQAATVPDRIALAFDDIELTYADLNAHANRLARHLRTLGVGPDVPVGICIQRSPEMVIALLAVFKAGGAYAALDPAYPSERLALMLADAKPKVVLTQAHLLDAIPCGGIDAFCVDKEQDRLQAYASGDLENVSQPGGLAYILYTSGSTGKPKGACMSIGALSNLIQWQLRPENRPAASPATVLQFASLNFDVSFQEIASALCAGDRLVLIDEDMRKDIEGLHRFIYDTGFDRIFLPNAVLQQFASLPIPENASKTMSCEIVTAGEQLVITDALLAYIESLNSQCLYNQYGPSESHVVTQFRLDCGDMKNWPDRPPIGKPIANTQIYLLDAYLDPVPVGVAGELYIAGEGLARGYLNRPDLTAEKFLPNPFSSTPGARMYKSGDLARYLPDGNIEYLGRIDNQVKIRGFRIELGEVETALQALPAVRDAVVTVREDKPGDKRLIAYVVPHEPLPDTEELRTALSQSLPDYMVPSRFMVLQQLPLTPNGKVDKRALPMPDAVRSAAGYVPPGTPTEQTLAEIWADLLGLDKVGIHDNFFSLGGHSLLATQVISKVRAAFRADLPLRILFESPTIDALAQRLQAAQESTDSTPPIVPVERQGAMPLSFAQQRLWFLDQFESGNALYNIPAAMRMSGRLDVEALERTLNEIVRRHEALRTVFATMDNSAVQIVQPSLKVALPITDLSDLPASEREAKAQRLAQQEAHTPFDLKTGPLIRTSLIRLEATEHLVLVNLHHIVSDGWSMGVLVKEVATLYAAFVQGRPSPLPALPIQYADFTHWQRLWLSGDVLQSQLDYWTRQLAGAPTLLTLPTDRPRPAVQTYRGATHSFSVPPELTAALHALGKQTQTTLFMILTAAFNVLLARYSGQSDICIGTPIANRNRAEIEPLIGFFVNTLVLRSFVDGNQTFASLLQQVRTTALGAYAHQDMPFEQLVEALKPERHVSHSPLFQVMLVLQNAPMDKLELPELTLRQAHPHSTISRFDISLNITEDEGKVQFDLVYNVDLFDAATMERMAKHFLHLLQEASIRPECRVRELAMMGVNEANTLIRTWNDTASLTLDASTPQTAHQLFEAQARRTPDGIALSFEGHTLSYAQLNARANQLARHLRDMGVGPDTLIGICTDRSIDTIVGLLGTLKAGGAYVPLDPAYPSDRLRLILDDAKPVAVLTQAHLRSMLPDAAVPYVCLDTELASLAVYAEDDLPNIALPSNLAYVIYTSGSTGKPKGVLCTHHGLCNLARTQALALKQEPGNRILQFASLNFDASTWEIFMALSSGATLCLAARERLMPGPDLEETLRELAIDAVTLPPVALSALSAERTEKLQTIVVAGEACPQSLVKQWAAGRRFFNAYGPTEATVCASLFHCRADDEGNPPIGKPIANTQIYLLDAYLDPVPVGVAGELYIAGEGLARGYLNRPDLTAEKFLPNPFSTIPGARMYKSGDMARYLPDGNIEYLGRIDNQVKIRGFRIELGEVEAALQALPAVRDAVVTVREDKPGDKRLIAYVVPHEPLPNTEELRTALSQSLPDYMVPSRFMVLQQLPLTPNGKVDKRALPMPDAVRSAAGYVPPGTPAEQTLAEIWADLLGLDKVGIHDNFFSLGGHSLLSVEVFQEIEHRLGVGLPVAMIFAAPTIASLADMIDAGRHAKSLLVPLQIEGDGTPLFCIHPVGGQVSFYRSLAESLRGRCPVYGIQSPEAAGLSLQFGSLDDMASAYCTAILDAQTEGPYRLAGWSTGGLIAMAVAAELEKRGCEVGYLGLLDTSPILAEVKTSQTQLTMGASLTALASIRGNSFTEAELASMQKVLSENAMSVADFFSDTHQMLALPFLEQWTGIAMTVDLWQHLKRQITSSTHHLELLAGFAPPALRAAWHIYSPEEFDQAVDRDLPVFVDRKSDWRLTAGSMEIVQGNHYNMLAAPHVESLAERMASRLCGETSLLNMRHTAPDLPACSCSR